MQFTGDYTTKYFGVGSETAPSGAFTTETDTGIYLDSPGSSSAFTITKRGHKRFRIDDDETEIIGPIVFDGGTSSSISLPDGSAGAPSLNFTDHKGTGLYYDGGFSVATGFANRLTIDNSGAQFVPRVISLDSFQGVINSIKPTHSFVGATDSGMGFDTSSILSLYRSGSRVSDWDTKMTSFVPITTGTNSLTTGPITASGTVSSGTNSLTTGSVTSSGVFKSADGSFTAPAYSFSSSTNSGIYNFGGAGVYVSVNGDIRAKIEPATTSLLGGLATGSGTFSGGVTATSLELGLGTISSGAITSSGTISSGTNSMSCGSVLAGVGSAGAPSHSFTGQTTSGMYFGTGANTVNLVTGALPRWVVSSAGVTAGTLPCTIGALSSSTITNSGTLSSGASTFSGVLKVPDGTNSAPSYTFTNGTNSGFSFDTNGSVKTSIAGTLISSLTPTLLTVPGIFGSSLLLGSGTISTTGAATVGALTSTSLSLGSGTLSTTGAASVGALTSTSITLGSGTLSTTGSVTTGALSSTTMTASGNVTLNGNSSNSILTTDASKIITSTSAVTSWSPSIGDGTNPFTGITATGSYLRLGPLVMAWGNINWTGKGSAVAGSAVVITLPIACNGTYYGNFTLNYNAGIGCPTGGTYIAGFAVIGQAVANLFGVALTTTGSTLNTVVVSNCATSGGVNFTAIYTA